MLSQREYLASLTPPMAIAGARGRFSKAAKAHLARVEAEGMQFSDGVGAVAPAPSADHSGLQARETVPVVYPKMDNDPVVRDLKTIQGDTEPTPSSPSGYLVESGVCFKCTWHVSRCKCSLGISPSPIVVRWARDIDREYGKALDSLATA